MKKRMRRYGPWLVALCVFAIANRAEAVDLSASVAKAVAYDPTLQASNYARQAGMEKVKQGRALYLPQISATGGYQRMWSKTTIDAPQIFPFQVLAPLESSGDIYGYGITVKQPLYDTGISVRATNLRDQAQLSDLNNQSTRQQLLANVAQAYFNVIVGEETLVYIRAEKDAVSHQLAGAEARFKAGRADATDVQDAKARYSSMLAQEISALNNLAEWRARYQRSVGVSPKDLLPLPKDFQPTPPDPDDMQAWIDRALTDNLKVRSALVQRNSAEKQVDLYTLSGRPKLNLVASYTDTRQDGDLSMLAAPARSENKVIGLQLSVPLYAGGGLVAKLHEAQANSLQADAQVQATRSDVEVQMRKTFQDVAAGAQRIAALEQTVKASKSALDANELGLKAGVKTTQDVLNAEQAYYQALEQLSQARYQYLMSKLNLDLLTGALDETSIARVNGWLHGG